MTKPFTVAPLTRVYREFRSLPAEFGQFRRQYIEQIQIKLTHNSLEQRNGDFVKAWQRKNSAIYSDLEQIFSDFEC